MFFIVQVILALSLQATLMLWWSLKVSIISGRRLVVEVILGFRSKVLVILIKCVLKISDSLLSSKTMQSSSEIINLLEKFFLCQRNTAYNFAKSFYCWIQVLVYLWKIISFSLS